MLLSMTGYGAGQAGRDGATATVELRSVNNRYLKLHSRLPEGYAALESRLEEEIRQQIRRGAIQLNVDLRRASSADDYRINSELIQSYYEQIRTLQAQLGVEAKVDLASFFVLPGVVQDEKSRSRDVEEDWPVIREALHMALAELRGMREVEGSAMSRDLTDQMQEIARCADEIAEIAPDVVGAYQSRLTERLNRLLDQHDIQVQPADVVREVGLFAERVDISEEIVRLRSHLDQFAEVMSGQDSGAGRKLDFLVQELLRETNTIGSKANDAEIGKRVVHIKTCIERIREMVQNVE